ncbi:hypothetical protein QTN25_008243 [Entamoeba marina]
MLTLSNNLLNSLTDVSSSSRLIEDVIARNIISYDCVKNSITLSQAELQEKALGLLREQDVRGVYVNKCIEFLNTIPNQITKEKDESYEEVIPMTQTTKIVQLIETVIVWGIFPGLTNVAIPSINQRTETESDFVTSTTRIPSHDDIKTVLVTMLFLFKKKFMLSHLCSYMIDIYAAIIEIGLSTKELESYHSFFPLEQSILTLIQLIPLNKKHETFLKTELMIFTIQYNGFPYILHHFSSHPFNQNPFSTAQFILNQLPPQHLQKQFLLFLQKTFYTLFDVNSVLLSHLPLLFNLIIPLFQTDELITKILIQPIQKMIQMDSIKFVEDTKSLVFAIKGGSIFIQITDDLQHGFIDKLDSTPYASTLMKLLYILITECPICDFKNVVSEAMSILLSTSNDYSKFIQTLVELPTNQTIPQVVEVLKKIFLTMSTSKQLPFLEQLASSSSDSEFLITTVLSLINELESLFTDSTPFIPLFQLLLTSSYATYVVNYLMYASKKFLSSPSIAIHQSTYSKLLSSILEVDGSVYTSLIEFLSAIPDDIDTSTDQKDLLDDLLNCEDEELPLILTKLRSQLIHTKSSKISTSSTSVKRVLTTLLSTTREDLQQLFITNLSLLSFHINIIPDLLSEMSKTRSSQSAAIAIELLISVIVHKQNKIEQQIPEIIRCVLSLETTGLLPVILILFLYIIKNVKNILYNPTVAMHIFETVKLVNLKEEDDVRSLCHLLRGLIDYIDTSNVTKIFSSTQLSYLTEISQSAVECINRNDKSAMEYVFKEFSKLQQYVTHKNDLNYLF